MNLPFYFLKRMVGEYLVSLFLLYVTIRLYELAAQAPKAGISSAIRAGLVSYFLFGCGLMTITLIKFISKNL